MVENDTFTYSMRKSKNDQINAADHSLITLERTQKLELLIHLISNLTQTLVICGPQGIGKTTLLRALHERKIDSWSYCLIQGSADLSFEVIQERVSFAVRPDKHDSQAQAFSQYQSKNKKIVLLIDDAGALVPGLITTIMQYAWTNPALRIVFALTHDELHVKSRTDRVVDDCHFVEIPPLSEKQCGDFLQQLSAKPWARLSLNAINDGMIRDVYRHTHGVPGKIIAEIPSLANAKKGINSLWILLAAVAGLVAVALGVQWHSSAKNSAAEAVTPVAADQQTVINSTQPIQVPTTQATETPVITQHEQPVQASEGILDQYIAKDVTKPAESEAIVISENKSKDKPDASMDAAGDNQQIKNSASVADVGQKPIESSAPDVQETRRPTDNVQAPKEQKTAVTDAQNDDAEWLKTQPPGNFTLQVMVLSKEQSIKDVIKKYPSLAQDLRYIKRLNRGKEKFLLLYGSFTSSASAYEAKQALPSEFSHSLVKEINAVKK